MSTKRSFVHGLDFAAAKKVALRAMQDYQQRLKNYALTINWPTPDRADVSFTVLNTRMHGQILVTPSNIEICVDVPLQFKFFENMAVQVVAKEVKACVDKAKAAGVV